MKSFALVLTLAMLATPVAVLAADAPPAAPDVVGAPAAPDPQMEAAFRQTHAQLEALRVQARSRMLASLTPAHRTLLANVVGALALSANPDPRAAAAQLDAQFAPAEKQSILAIDAAARANAHAIMEQQRAAFEARLTSQQRSEMAARRARMEAFHQSHPRPAWTPDAGMIALHTLGNFGGHGMPFEHGGRPMPG